LRREQETAASGRGPHVRRSEKARQRVGDLITKAILGVPLYKLYCGEPGRTVVGRA